MITEQSKQASSVPAFDRRAMPRFKTANHGTVTNITRLTKQQTALILDMSRSGMKIETKLAVSPGDALRIDLPDSTLLAEAVYCERTLDKTVIGLKLFYTINNEQLRRYVTPETSAA